MPAPGQHVHRQAGGVGELHVEDAFAGHAGQRLLQLGRVHDQPAAHDRGRPGRLGQGGTQPPAGERLGHGNRFTGRDEPGLELGHVHPGHGWRAP